MFSANELNLYRLLQDAYFRRPIISGMQSNTNQSNVPNDSQKPYVLWLASWYPSVFDPLLGDFIQRQAIALAMLLPIRICTIIDDPVGEITRTWKLEITQTGALEECRLYVYTGALHGTIFYKYWKVIRLLWIGKKVLNEYLSKETPPKVIHTHIAMYMGVLGRYFSMKFKTPHIISEQWTAYLPEAKPNISSFNVWSKRQLKNVFRHASAVTGVSEYLLKYLKPFTDEKQLLRRIPNVVDGNLFIPGEKASGMTRFITISASTYQKNLDDILEATRILAKKSDAAPFELLIVHSPDEAFEKKVAAMGVDAHIKLIKPMDHCSLAALMSSCNAMILYSRYETFGCVVIEALSCGIPVIGSDIPVMRELISHGSNGLLCRPESPEDLALGMQSIITKSFQPAPAQLRKSVLKEYSFSLVAKQFKELYQDLDIKI
jgi:glycosyltransferase involved in cell wall biosynthesis